MGLWSIPSIYLIVTVASGLVIPRLEAAYLADLNLQISAASALAYFSTVASGMMAMTGVTFAMAFVTAQFGSVASYCFAKTERATRLMFNHRSPPCLRS